MPKSVGKSLSGRESAGLGKVPPAQGLSEWTLQRHAMTARRPAAGCEGNIRSSDVALL
jgi:hypothetical protein